ncbi:MAG: type II toxin-antitoxin system RelE/ParE family toxin [Ilyomonas sp.]
MVYEIIFKKRFINKLNKLCIYLDFEWGNLVTQKFINKLNKRLETLSHQPYIGSTSEVIKNVRGILITKHNKVFYRIWNDKIIILNMYDTRMNPKKRP